MHQNWNLQRYEGVRGKKGRGKGQKKKEKGKGGRRLEGQGIRVQTKNI